MSSLLIKRAVLLMRFHFHLSFALIAAVIAVATPANASAPAKTSKPALAAGTAAAHILAQGQLSKKSPKLLAGVSISNSPAAKPARSSAKGTVKASKPIKIAAKQSSSNAGAPKASPSATANVASATTSAASASESASPAKVALAPQGSLPGTSASAANGATGLASMQPLNPVVNTAPMNSSEPKMPGASNAAPNHPMVLTPAPAYETMPSADRPGKMAKIGGWFNQRVLRRPGAPVPSPYPVQNAPATHAAKPAASPYLIANEGAPTVTYWPPTSTNVAVHTYGAVSDRDGSAVASAPIPIPQDMKPAILIVKLAPGIYPAAIGSLIDRVHGMVMGSHGPEYMRTLRIAVNRNDVPQAMKLLTGNRSVQYVVPEELLGVASAPR